MSLPQPNEATTAERVYLDYAAATPLCDAARTAMAPYWSEYFGNANALHAEGRAARAAVTDARAQFARGLGVQPAAVTFTGGGTESSNLAILGYLRTLHVAGRPYTSMTVLTTPIEHPATTNALAEAARWGVTVVEVPVDAFGQCQPDTVASYVTPDTVLMSVAHVNSEIGVMQPTRAIARTLARYQRSEALAEPIRLHVDAAQSPLWLSVRLDQLGADMLSLDAGKFAGPKGVGVLATARPRLVTEAVAFGGGQEQGVRPGTEATPGIIGAAAAWQEAQATVVERAAHVASVRDAGLAHLASTLPDAVVNGPVGDARVANNLNFSLPGFDTEYTAIVLDQHGYAVSTKSACSSSDSAASRVVAALDDDPARARSTLRLTLGPTTTAAELTACLDMLAGHVAHMRPYRT